MKNLTAFTFKLEFAEAENSNQGLDAKREMVWSEGWTGKGDFSSSGVMGPDS